MNIFKHFRRNNDLIVQGALCVIGEDDDGKEISFRIARAHDSYAVFQNSVQDKIESKKRTLDSLAKTDKRAESKLRTELVLAAFVETCIKGWSNVKDENGNDLPYSEDALQKIADLPELVEDLFKFASTDSNYVGEFDEKESLKN